MSRTVCLVQCMLTTGITACYKHCRNAESDLDWAVVPEELYIGVLIPTTLPNFTQA